MDRGTKIPTIKTRGARIMTTQKDFAETIDRNFKKVVGFTEKGFKAIGASFDETIAVLEEINARVCALEKADSVTLNPAECRAILAVFEYANGREDTVGTILRTSGHQHLDGDGIVELVRKIEAGK